MWFPPQKKIYIFELIGQSAVFSYAKIYEFDVVLLRIIQKTPNKIKQIYLTLQKIFNWKSFLRKLVGRYYSFFTTKEIMLTTRYYA